MACISKLARAIPYNCDSGATGLNSAIIINKADIVSFSVDDSTMAYRDWETDRKSVV